MTGKLCIEVTPQSKIAFISEELCIGCGICVKVRLLIIRFRLYPFFMLFNFFAFACRNALLRPFRLSTCQRIWIRTLLTVMVQIPSSFTGPFSIDIDVLIFSVWFRWCFDHCSYFRLPVPRPGQVLGLVGTNGIGKSTALKVLAGKLKPNLGRFNVMPHRSSISYHCIILYCFLS